MWTDKTDLNGTFSKYLPILVKYGFDAADLQSRWNEPHRVYHNQEHLDSLLLLIEQWRSQNKARLSLATESQYEALVLTAIFHDIIYDPRSSVNEEESAKFFMERSAKVDQLLRAQVNCMILDTKDHSAGPHPTTPDKELSEVFLRFDIHNLIYGTVSDMIAVERKIFREFGFVDFSIYKEARSAKFLDKFVPYIKKINPNSQIESYSNWFKNHTPRIAVFAGTFFPFHKGHHDVLKKAERMFDKVIVLTCINPQKTNDFQSMEGYVSEVLSKKLPNNQVELYKGMLHQYVARKQYPVTIVKGLRNPSDFDSEKLQLRYMEDLFPAINVTYIVSDRKYEHVSSSGIKQIKSFGLIEEANKYIF